MDRAWRSSKALEYLITHLVLPPKLPQNDDADLETEHALLVFVQDTARLYSSLEPSWIGVQSMLTTLTRMLSRQYLQRQSCEANVKVWKQRYVVYNGICVTVIRD